MSEESPLLELRDQLRAKVDAKMQEMPEFRQLTALEELISKTAAPAEVAPLDSGVSKKQSIVALAMAYIARTGEPQPTRVLVPHIDSVKNFGDPKKAKVNVVSALSKDPRVKSVQWHKEPMWWLADKPLPKAIGAHL